MANTIYLQILMDLKFIDKKWTIYLFYHQYRSLQKTLNDLKDYQRKHDFWQQQNEKLLAEQVPANIKINQHVAHESLRMQQANVEIGSFLFRLPERNILSVLKNELSEWLIVLIIGHTYQLEKKNVLPVLIKKMNYQYDWKFE